MARRGRRSRKRNQQGPPWKRNQQGRAAAPYEVRISSRALVQTLLVVALALLAWHAASAVYHYRIHELPRLLRQLFDVDQENNLPTWYSGFLLLVASGFLWLCAVKKRAEADPWVFEWYALAVGFLLLSIDEVAGVHETINTIIVMTWAIPAAFLALVIGLAFVPFLLDLPRRTALLFVLAGAAYVGGGAGMEIVGNKLVAQNLRDTLEYNLWTLAEEGCEMLGIVLFLHALLHHMRAPGRNAVHASFEPT